ncbi:MAG TPA: hypothetical protein VK511_04280 [Gemmatimonadaceae bacterium]|nr:hypothetical protein [Gemmatimonadaceae bacterium]
MTTSILRITATLGAVLVTTAAVCNKDSGASAAPENIVNTAAPTASSGPGLPADFPIDPALSACKPIISGPEVNCDWHDIDGHAAYTFFHDALPKAGYTLDAAKEAPPPHYMGFLAFRKGNVKGAISIPNTDLSIGVITGQ